MANSPHFRTGRPPDMSIDWEALPSLRSLLSLKRAPRAPQPVWADTMPSAFEAAAPSTPFAEPMPGLVVREVDEPEVFSALFGTAARRVDGA